MDRKLINKSFTIYQEHIDKMEAEASREDTNLSRIVRKALDNYFKKKGYSNAMKKQDYEKR